MNIKREILLDFEVDKLTNSIENSLSGEVFDTQIHKVHKNEKIKQSDWVFDWKSELKDPSKTIYSLTTLNNPKIVQGLLSITDKGDHIFMNLIENAKFNRGKNKLYLGVTGNLIAFACKVSFEQAYDGIVSFIAKTQLIEHYKLTLGAKLFADNRMYIDTNEAKILTVKYFKDFKL